MRVNKRKFTRAAKPKDTYLYINLQKVGKGMAWIAGTVLVVMVISWIHQGFKNRASTHLAGVRQNESVCKRIAAGKTYYVHEATLTSNQVCTVVGTDGVKTDFDL
jgi:hypothetical protein